MSNYEIYREMYNKASEIERTVKKDLLSSGWKVYNFEVYVGEEETEKYMIYFEGVSPKWGYKNFRGLYTLEKINDIFKAYKGGAYYARKN